MANEQGVPRRSLIGIELDTGGVLVSFTQTAAETGGERHVEEARYVPRSPMPPYSCHPKQDERFEIIEGPFAFALTAVATWTRARGSSRIESKATHDAANRTRPSARGAVSSTTANAPLPMSMPKLLHS